MVKRGIWVFLVLLISTGCYAQKYPAFTHFDTLRGKLNTERTCYNVFYYDLHLKVNPEEHTISGYNVIHYTVVTDFSWIQIDLFRNMKIDSIYNRNKRVKYARDSNVVYIFFQKLERKGKKDSLTIYYHGSPQVAKNPPWDGGFVWSKDSNGKPWVDVACEGTGASLWWPCKDYLGAKPDSMRMNIDVPNGLVGVSNGRLRSVTKADSGYTRYTWFVSVPIINYDVTLNVGDYTHISDYYLNGKDTLTLNYYVLRYNEQKARTHFTQVKPMLACYEKFFGKYPFYKDGYKLVETTYWGMEHQSCVAYGNNYKNNEFGFDFIIIHESAHEWWGNSLSCTDVADMWLHEAFATYAEALYVESKLNYKTAVAYLKTQQQRIKNEYPIIGPYDVNFQGTKDDDDMYFKGTWMLQTFRHVVNNDSIFFAILHGLQTRFKYSSTNTDEVIRYINQITGKDYSPFFNQYLQRAGIPILKYKLKQRGNATILTYRWDSIVTRFTMPVKVTSKVQDSANTYIFITPSRSWKTIKLNNLSPSQFSVDLDEFYIKPEKED